MDKKIQAIVKVNGVITFYFYDEEIERMVSNHVKSALAGDGKEAVRVETELFTPALTYDQLKEK